jgi:hypothetical protein
LNWCKRTNSFFEEKYESNWATNFKRMLYEALEIKKELKPDDYSKKLKSRDDIFNELEDYPPGVR